MDAVTESIIDKTKFRRQVLSWFARHGRKDLPWQRNPTPYRVWVSEIMLQQTQVATVIPYFNTFMAKFPSVRALATADIDEVLQYWSGLGYYARARNLHKAAAQICAQHRGRFPDDFDAVLALPGIGRSTAGAILSLAKQRPHAILDGNVKRVLARFFTLSGWPGHSHTQDQFWHYAEMLTPTRAGPGVAAYNQAMMDLGATLCTRSKPRCERCPLRVDCAARRDGRQADFPSKKPRKPLPVKQTLMLLLINEDNTILMEQRPPSGLWGGLLCFPQLSTSESISHWCKQSIGSEIHQQQQLTTLRHSLSHFHLDITAICVWIKQNNNRIMEPGRWVWYKDNSTVGGLPAPVSLLLRQFYKQFSQRFG